MTFASAPPLTWVPASAWRNAGRLTPKAALETILWASADGDVNAVANAISLGATARANAEKILRVYRKLIAKRWVAPNK